MKTGLLTVHQSVNSGASLQAAALYSVLDNVGCNPILVDYCPKYFVDYTDPLYKKERSSLKGRVKMALIGDRLESTKQKFHSFIQKNCNRITERYEAGSLSQLKRSDIDAWVCGSDQVWNPTHVHYDPAWLFDFTSPGAKTASYAASIGKDKLNVDDYRWLKSGLSRISAISVREDSAVSILHELGYEATQCLDPTLLFEASHWRELEVRPEVELPDKYIFYYPLEANPVERKMLAKLKKTYRLPCVALTDALFGPPEADVQVCGFGPDEFLYLIDNAEVVFTNSFHGFIFSYLFKKDLVAFKNTTKNSRLESLQRLLEVNNYQIESAQEISTVTLEKKFKIFRTSGARYRLEEERNKSIEFLKKAICD